MALTGPALTHYDPEAEALAREGEADWLTDHGFPTECPKCGMDLSPDMVQLPENPRWIVCEDCDWSWIG